MPALPIVEYPDPRLRQRCEPVERFDDALAELLTSLRETLVGSTGIGLSAPQIGVMQRALVTRNDSETDDTRIFINPEILKRGGLTLVEESCLSLPGLKANLFRSAELRVRAQNRDGEIFECDLEGMHAVCLQHEVDHLDGKLFVDRLGPLRRWRLRAMLAELERREVLPAA